MALKHVATIAMPLILGNEPRPRGLDLSTIWSTVSNYGPTDAPRDEKLGDGPRPEGFREAWRWWCLGASELRSSEFGVSIDVP